MSNYLTDVEIARSVKPQPISEIAEKAGILKDEIELYGNAKAKVDLSIFDRLKEASDGKLILVTAMTPTPAGEGKTTVTIGIGDAIHSLGYNSSIAIREPSLGPCFGIKGGAAGGGYSQVIPMEDINLHFTGDFHAVTSAHNLLAAMLDNSLFQGNPFDIDEHTITFNRVMDMNDRTLRNIVIGLGGRVNGITREAGFEITTASEIMALLCLANDLQDLESRLEKIIVAFNSKREPITAKDINASGAMAVLLKDAIKPNLVQTLEGTPTFVHGGPFANIAHGCNSILATKLALKLSDYVVTEAGFASDLGAEKFFDIKCRTAGVFPSAVVIVATVRALKYHGGIAADELKNENIGALEHGFVNLKKHCENIESFGIKPIVAINRFTTDTDGEIATLSELCFEHNIDFAISTAWGDGSKGALELVEKVFKRTNDINCFDYIYSLDMPIAEKVTRVAKVVYGADEVRFLPAAEKGMEDIAKLGYGNLPICIAKTQNSLSDDPTLKGRPEGFKFTVRHVKLSAGAGFVVIYSGNIMTMPGLPKTPAAENIRFNEHGEIEGLF